MSTARVTILLATFQGEAYLGELLRSVQSQTHADWTLLVRDDGSTDSTRQILRDIAAGDRRIMLVDDDNLRRGAVGNFAWLLKKAWQEGGDYCLLADQDDVWHQDKIARQLQALQNAEASVGREMPQLVFCDAAVVDATRQTLHASFLRQNRLPYCTAMPLKTLLARSYVLGCTTAINRALLNLAVPLPEAAASHDWWLALCAACAGRVTCLDVPLLEYRRHTANTSESAIWNIVRGGWSEWRRRWQVGWRNFVQSLDQAKALHYRLQERKIAASQSSELLETFCKIVEQPGGLRRVRALRGLGLPAIDWSRRRLYEWCIWRL